MATFNVHHPLVVGDFGHYIDNDVMDAVMSPNVIGASPWIHVATTSEDVELFSEMLNDKDIATGWIECLMMALRLPIHPEAIRNPTADAWRCVKWTARVIRRWMQLCAVNDALRQVEVNFSAVKRTAVKRSSTSSSQETNEN